MRWEQAVAYGKIQKVMQATGLRYHSEQVVFDAATGNKVTLIAGRNGIRVQQHKNTWKRKRESSYLVCIEYFLEGVKLMHHVEPWVQYPSDHLIAKMMLLPPEVKK